MQNDVKKGLFITFEGIDGCGKSTQLWEAARYLSKKSKYEHLLLTREPYHNQDIRKILAEDDNPYTRAEKLAKMFIEDRKEHIAEVILPALISGVHVLSDRYWMSTLVYQSTQGVDLQKLIKMHGTIPIPDVTFLVDIPVSVALERMKNDAGRKEEQKFERNKEFIEKLRQTYLGLPRQLKNYPTVVVDGRKGIEEIFLEQIAPEIDRAYTSRHQ